MRAKTPSFILELPLKATAHDSSVLTTVFEASRQLYNACLGEANRRYYLMKQSKEYQRARRLPKPTKEQWTNEPALAKEMASARRAAFSEAADNYEFTEYSLSKYATRVRKSWLQDHVESNIAQKLSKRAFQAVQKKAFGRARRVRFKNKNALSSVEGKNNKQGLIFRDRVLSVAGLKLPALVDPTNKYQNHGLTSRVKYCRLIRRNFNGHLRFSVQLILEGIPYSSNPKHPIGTEEVGLDIGPSTIAYVGDTTAELKQFCAEIVPDWKATRRLQRKMDRSRRANNKDNYNPNGTVIRGSKIWTKSKRYQKLQQKYAETNRKMAAHRKSLHGNLANEILAIGSKISTEKISYRAWQKMFGKSILVRAPSMIVSLIRRKAENAHGHLHEIPTKSTALSQTCHICGAKVKKPLSQRWHNCCGMHVQRDLYAAFLAKCCVKSDNNDSFSLDSAKAAALWTGAEQLLDRTMSRVDQEFSQPTIGRNPVPASFGLGQSRSGSSDKPV